MEKDLLARGIEGVEYEGLPDEEIAVLVGGQRLEELHMTLDDLAHEVGRVSANVPAGTIGRGQGSRQLRSLDQQRDPLGFQQLVIEHGDSLVRVGDIARGGAPAARRSTDRDPRRRRGHRDDVDACDRSRCVAGESRGKTLARGNARKPSERAFN